MRRLMWFAIGFSAACGVGAYLVSGSWLLLLALLCLVGAVAMVLLRNRWKPGKILATLLIGAVVGLCWQWAFDACYLANARGYDGQKLDGEITIADYGYNTDYGVASDGTITLDGKEYRVLLYVNGQRTLCPSDQVTGSFRLRFTGEGGAKEPTYHAGKGIYLLAYTDYDVTIHSPETVSLKYFPAELRQKIVSILDATFPVDALGFARALLLGDSSLLTYRQDTDFKTSGIRHVIAVSGLHVSILFSLVYLVSGRRRGLTALLGIPLLLLFAAVAGFTPSITRACVMQILMILALLLNKEYDPPTALAFSVLVMLVVNPLTITSVSFQLSVGCMVGIFLLSGRVRQYLLRRMGGGKGKNLKAVLIRWLAGSTAITLSAMVFTTPLSAWYFGTVSLIGVVTNLLTLWVISFIFYGIMAACALGALWLPLGKGIAWIVSWLIRYVLLAAKTMVAFPLAAVYTCSIYIVLWLVGCYGLFAAFLLSKNRRPALTVLCMTLGLCLAVAASWVEPRLDTYRVSVLDVGQGQCILLQSQGKSYLVDCGGDDDENTADIAAQTLLSQGITSLDGLILTHYDGDHAGGAEPLLSRISAQQLYLPDVSDGNGIRQRLEAEYSQQINWINGETTVSFGSASVTLFPSKDQASDNESSMCILFQAENCDILITGDRSTAGERRLLQETELPKLEVLVVGHHGSKASTSLELLHATWPEYAVISVGDTNNYGHPAPETLERLSRYGCKIRRTDLEGTIIFRG